MTDNVKQFKPRNTQVSEKQEDTVKQGSFDPTILLCTILLVMVGTIMIFSSSYYSSTATGQEPYYYLYRQLALVALGGVLMGFAMFIPYQNYQRWVWPLYLITNFVLLLVLIIGKTSGGATRWFMGVQPSEPAKLVVILTLAHLVSTNKHPITEFKFFCLCLAVAGLPLALIIAENMSTGIIVGVITVGILFCAGAKILHFIPFGIAAVAALYAKIVKSSGFRGKRFAAWLNPTIENAYQTMQGLFAVGSGGFFGAGLGNSRQKLGFIPESHNDIIFAVVCEELGGFGAAIIIIIYLILLWRCVKAAINATSMFGTLVVIGVAVMIGVQVFINVAVVTNTIPNTGIPLPFISYGGSSLITFMVSMGIVLNISRYYRD